MGLSNNTEYDNYFKLPLEEKKQLVNSMKFWIMWDIVMGSKGYISNETQTCYKELLKDYDKDICDKLVVYCSNSLSSEFLKQYKIDPVLIENY